LVLDDGREHFADVFAVERLAAGEHLVEDDAKGPNVGALVDGPTSGLLGTHVGCGAKDDSGLRGVRRQRGRNGGAARRCGRVHRLRQPEVQHLYGAVVFDLDVRRLQVAVDDALFMRGLGAPRQSASQSCTRSLSGIRPRAIRLRELFSGDQLPHG
jgi:hypothetical protein